MASPSSSNLIFNITNSSTYLLILLLPLLLLTTPSYAQDPNSPIPTKTLCKSTPDSAYCLSILGNNSTSNLYTHGRFSIQRALEKSRNFLDKINSALQDPNNTTLQINALQDCLSLAQTNVDFLSNTLLAINKTNKIFSFSQADDYQTLLSAILTNQETCLDGIKDSNTDLADNNDLLSLIHDSEKLYSLSLSLFTKAWVPGNRSRGNDLPVKRHVNFRKGRLPLKMSAGNRAIYDWAVSRRGRRLLQAPDEPVVVNGIVVVSLDGTGNYTNITSAINAAPKNSLPENGYFLIYVTAGVYAEYVNVPSNKKYVLMIGDGINQTVITGNNSVVDGSTTFNSATLIVSGTGFVGAGLTVRNTAGPSKGQAVALRSSADLSTFYSCSFEGYQDTLYTHSLRQFYRECDIYGTVDFIFGNAAVVLQNCNLYARQPNRGQFNALTAQGKTDPNQNTGTAIQNCTIKAASDLISSNFTTKSYLGRPWKLYSTTVYMQSFIDSLIDPSGWNIWSGDYALNTSFYGEFGNIGPGSNTSQRVSWSYQINETIAGTYTVSSFLVGDQWLPQTSVPYTGGLI